MKRVAKIAKRGARVGVSRHVKGHINAKVVSGRHNAEAVKEVVKQRAREINNAVQENVQEDKLVLGRVLAVSVRAGKVGHGKKRDKYEKKIIFYFL